MSLRKKRTKYTSELKAQIALESVKDQLTIKQLAVKFSVHRNQVSKWKRQLLDNLPLLFQYQPKDLDRQQNKELVNKLSKQVEQTKAELKWLKKRTLTLSLKTRKEMLEPKNKTIRNSKTVSVTGFESFLIL